MIAEKYSNLNVMKMITIIKTWKLHRKLQNRSAKMMSFLGVFDYDY